jgi:hypothetical protein
MLYRCSSPEANVKGLYLQLTNKKRDVFLLKLIYIFANNGRMLPAFPFLSVFFLSLWQVASCLCLLASGAALATRLPRMGFFKASIPNKTFILNSHQPFICSVGAG